MSAAPTRKAPGSAHAGSFARSLAAERGGRASSTALAHDGWKAGLSAPPLRAHAPSAPCSERPELAERGATNGATPSRALDEGSPKSSTEDALAASGLPFRPLPSCMFEPTGRSPAAPPSVPDDLSRLAGELLRSLHVGGTRARGQVRLVLDGGAAGEDLEVTLDDTPTGVVATLQAPEGTSASRLARAIERELERRAIAVETDG